MRLSHQTHHFFLLYGKRNSVFLPGLRVRIDFLNLAIGDLQEAIRKEEGMSVISVALARVVSRIFCVVEHFRELPLAAALARKYPLEHCSYCGQYPCQCQERRSNPSLASCPSEQQLQWGIAEWALHLNELYGSRNKEKGIENLLNRLFKEISELLSCSLQLVNATTTLTIAQIEEEYALELADAFAWTIAIANELGIDLERAVFGRYGNGCWRCKTIPCCCSSFNMAPVDWSLFRQGE